jgi:hypothetical protein
LLYIYIYIIVILYIVNGLKFICWAYKLEYEAKPHI